MFSEINWPSKVFITGIDTDAGKSYVTGWLARSMMDEGMSVITQKFIQTGNKGFSEDIEVHRRIMGIDPLPEDLEHLTAPEIFTYPASADLASRIDRREISFERILKAAEILNSRYDHLLIEGAGGLMVPLKEEYLSFDFIKDHDLPVILVTNGRLGSISHTLLSLYAIKNSGIRLFAIIYNSYFDKDEIICADTREYLQKWTKHHFPDAIWMEAPSLNK